MAVEAFQLGEIEAGGRAADAWQVEGGDHFLGGKYLLVAVAPSEPDQVIAQRRRQVSHGAIGIHAQRPVALREFRAVGPMDQGNVRHAGNVPRQRIVDLLLARGVDQVVVAADDVGDAHVVIVDHDGEHVGRIAIATQQHEVVEVLVLPDHAALDLILDHGLAGLGRPEPDRGLHAGRRFRGVAVAPQAVIEARAALGARLFPHRREFLRRGVAAIGLAAWPATARPPRGAARPG